MVTQLILIVFLFYSGKISLTDSKQTRLISAFILLTEIYIYPVCSEHFLGIPDDEEDAPV